MIHEIAPKKLLNTYEKRAPEADSEIICAWGNTYLIVHEEGGDRYPLYGEIAKQLPGAGLKYLFAVDGEKRCDYFLQMLEEKPAFSLPAAWSWEQTDYLKRRMTPRHEAFAGMTAQHLYVWYRDNRFCGRCGGELLHDERERMLRCPSCGGVVYPRIAPAVIAAVRHEGKLLLTKYAHGDGNYALVAGFVEIGETAEECVAREVMEETGLRVKNVRYYGSQPWGFVGNLMLAYTAELDGSEELRVDFSELASVEWVAPEELCETDDYSSLTREMIRRFREGRL